MRTENDMESKKLNDLPIKSKRQDLYGFAPFAENLAMAFINIKDPVGTTIGLHGPWGSGKSSIVNMVKEFVMSSRTSNLHVVNFQSLWFRGEETLALALFGLLSQELEKEVGWKTARLLRKAWGLTKSAVWAVLRLKLELFTNNILSIEIGVPKFIKKKILEPKSLEKTFEELSEKLRNQQKKILIVIDDIDRLYPEESMAVFRFLRSVGHLPNVMYLAVFDRDLVEKIVSEQYPSEEPHFLEKVIQAGFEIPEPSSDDLYKFVEDSIIKVCEVQPHEFDAHYYEVISHLFPAYIVTPRCAVRLLNVIQVTWPALSGNVNFADFLAVEIIKLFEPTLAKVIMQNKENICGVCSKDDVSIDQISLLVDNLASEKQVLVKTALENLFPRLTPEGQYLKRYLKEWDLYKRVCHEDHFDTYFKLHTGKRVLTKLEVDELIRRAGDPQYITTIFRRAARARVKNGKSRVPVYLNALTLHAGEINESYISVLLTTLINLYDEIDFEEDSERRFGKFQNTSVRYFDLIKNLLATRFTVDERDQLFRAALQNVPLYSLIKLIDKIALECLGGKKSQVDNEPLFSERLINEIYDDLLNSIRKFRYEGTLLITRKFELILDTWQRLTGPESEEVLNWTNSILCNHSELRLYLEQLRNIKVTYWSSKLLAIDKDFLLPIHVLIEKPWFDINRFESALHELLKNETIDNKFKVFINRILSDIRSFQEMREGAQNF